MEYLAPGCKDTVGMGDIRWGSGVNIVTRHLAGTSEAYWTTGWIQSQHLLMVSIYFSTQCVVEVGV